MNSTVLRTSMFSEELVPTEGFYVAVYDEQSPANVLNYLTSGLEAAKVAARRDGLEEHHSLVIFNEQLMSASAKGEALSWTLLFDGIFKAHLKIGDDILKETITEIRNLGENSIVCDLECPSGRIMISCLSRMGRPCRPIAVVSPGNYRVSVNRNEDLESTHFFLESPSELQANEEADWRILVQRIVSRANDA